MIFKDRQGSNLNRKRIKIISQTPNEIIADIERYDNVTEEGTAINAKVLNDFQSEINTANNNASTASNVANNASNLATSAKATAESASSLAEKASMNADAALSKATKVESTVADRGTTIYVSGTAKTDVNFDSNPQDQINDKLVKDFGKLASKETMSDTDLLVVQSELTNSAVKFSLLKSIIFNAIYPVGSIYMSINATNPSTLFGGKWEQLQDRFLLGAGSSYTAGNIGGEASHTLTIDEIPSHNHENQISVSADQNSHRHSVRSGNGKATNAAGLGYSWCYAVGGCDNDGSSRGWYDHPYASGDTCLSDSTPNISVTSSITNASAGSGLAHNNMPPYLTVYMWKRIS